MGLATILSCLLFVQYIHIIEQKNCYNMYIPCGIKIKATYRDTGHMHGHCTGSSATGISLLEYTGDQTRREESAHSIRQIKSCYVESCLADHILFKIKLKFCCAAV